MNYYADCQKTLCMLSGYGRCDIKNMADGVFDEPATEDLVDMCMEGLDRFNGSFMENESIQMCVNETIRYRYKGAQNGEIQD